MWPLNVVHCLVAKAPTCSRVSDVRRKFRQIDALSDAANESRMTTGPISEMTYTVSSGSLNCTIPYYDNRT